MSDKQQSELPPRPIEPEPAECCGRGCDPCIFTYYERALKKWEEKVAAIQRRQQQQS
ncbi:MAG: oxidoreductase-like domain-containing protein [Thiotrichales bacterium]|nr:oxidoreductase-like domain-containing protein [Thiotrichales bacterium]